MPTAREYIDEANVLIDKAEKILIGGTAEEKQQVEKLMTDAAALKNNALNMQSIEEIRKEIKDFSSANNGGAASPTGGAKFRNMGDFLTSVNKWYTDLDQRLVKFRDNDEKAAETRDMSGQTGGSGGFLIPTEFQATLMSVVGDRSIVRPRATVIPMTRRQIQIPILDQTGATAGLPHWFGGLRAYWTEEAGEKQASDAKFRQMVLTAWKLIMFTRASDELLDDSAVSLSAFLAGQMGFAGAIAWTEDYSFINGNGVGQPLGYLNAAALGTIGVARAGAGTITYPDLTKMIKAFLPTGRGVWIISQSAMAQLLEMSGPAGNPSYIWGSAVLGAPNTLLGYPVIWTEKAPILGSRGDISLVDLSYYLIGDRQATTVESTKFEKWEYDLTSWRAVHRVDGKPWLSAPLTYQDGTTQVSPFVALNA